MTLQPDGPKRLDAQTTSGRTGKIKKTCADGQYLSQLYSIFYSSFVITILQKHPPKKEILISFNRAAIQQNTEVEMNNENTVLLLNS